MSGKVIGLDLDGVLASSPLAATKPWGKMSGPERQQRRENLLFQYAQAHPLFLEQLKPYMRFHVITARKNTPDVQSVTHEWLHKHYPDRVLSVHFLDKSRSLKNVIAFKSDVLKKLGVTHFTEDNLEVLKGLKFHAPGVKLFFFRQGLDHPVEL